MKVNLKILCLFTKTYNFNLRITLSITETITEKL